MLAGPVNFCPILSALALVDGPQQGHSGFHFTHAMVAVQERRRWTGSLEGAHVC